MIAKFGMVAIQGLGVLRTRTWGRGVCFGFGGSHRLGPYKNCMAAFKKLNLVVVFIYVTRVNYMTQIQT